MPIPLTDLDTRRWDDLVEEGRGLIPRYSPGWTDHNIHDPGVTLIELLAWLIEQDVYRVNRVPARHYRKFLQLLGFVPEPPQPARVPLSFTLVAGPAVQVLPAGTTLVTSIAGSRQLHFRTIDPLTVVPSELAALHVFDGAKLSNQTRNWRERLPILLLGENPRAMDNVADQPAFYLGFDQPLPPAVPVSIWFQITPGGADWKKRELIIDEVRQQAKECIPIRPTATCPPEEPRDDIWCPDSEISSPSSTMTTTHGMPPHHSVRLAWDYFGDGQWRTLDPASDQVHDDTRGMTLDGQVILNLPSAMDPIALDGDPGQYFYVRCRLDSGQFDGPPVVQQVTVNTVVAEQASAVRSSFEIPPGATLPPAGTLVAGQRARLLLWIDDDGTVERIEVSPNDEVPETLVVDFSAPTGTVSGRLEVTTAHLGSGTGFPDQSVTLPGGPVARGDVTVWSQLETNVLHWRERPDLDASQPTDASFMLNATDGLLAFGSGDRGRTVPAGAQIFGAYDTTEAALSNVAPAASWMLQGADDALNSTLFGEDVAVVATRLASIVNHVAATGGMDEESIRQAAGRAAEMLWAHERLLQICPSDRCESLDNLAPEVVVSQTIPGRAVTLLDYERLALGIPGVEVQRARAFAGIDPAYPCLRASGTVTVVVVPALPAKRPQPSTALLAAVRAFLDRRRTIGTRLVVIGPEYLEVRVRVTIRTTRAADPVRVRADVIAALDKFLDPLSGGPSGRGWPFGHDVHRSEILQTIDATAGVDHVLSLDLTGVPGEAQCGSLCVPPTWLVTPGPHEIEVIR